MTGDIKGLEEQIAIYQCPQWETCTAHTDPDTHICDHVRPHEWITADGDECDWRPSPDGECSKVCEEVTQ